MTDSKVTIEFLKKHLSAPFVPKKVPQIKIAKTASQARKLVQNGWTAVECSFGDISVVCEKQLDHHGDLRDLEGVALRGYRDFYGACLDDPRIVVTGFPDEDATWCIASLLAMLPNPLLGDVFPGETEINHLRRSQNLEHIAELINDVDIDPSKGSDLDSMISGRLMITWRQLGHPERQDIAAWWSGVDRWRNLTERDFRTAIDAGVQIAEERFEQLLSSPCSMFGEKSEVAAIDFTEFGRNTLLYDHWTENKTPVLVAFFKDTGVCTISVRDLKWARKNIGPDGLIHLYRLLTPHGAGGREIIGGGNRRHRFTWDEAEDTARQLAALLAKIRKKELNFNPKKKKRTSRKKAGKK